MTEWFQYIAQSIQGFFTNIVTSALRLGTGSIFFGANNEVEMTYSAVDAQIAIKTDPNAGAFPIPGFVAIPLSDPGYAQVILCSKADLSKFFSIVVDGNSNLASIDFSSLDAGLQLGTGFTSKLAFYGATPIAQQTGVAVSAAGIHAALVNLGLITA
jgi:hypothetical protein